MPGLVCRVQCASSATGIFFEASCSLESQARLGALAHCQAYFEAELKRRRFNLKGPVAITGGGAQGKQAMIHATVQ